MSGPVKWSLGSAVVLLIVSALCAVLDLVPAAVIAGMLGLAVFGVAVYEALDAWLARVQLRRRGERARRGLGRTGRGPY